VYRLVPERLHPLSEIDIQPILGRPLDAITIKKNKSGREQWAYDGRFMYIPNFNAAKSETEFNQSAAQLGLKTIVFDSCYISDTECQKNLKVKLDRVYWLP
jgi:hypothetical protein